ncbi:hypothetical protein [Rufibacter tibetensis]|uniref:hypothetical protein n=1 Tax=Rufibacter tibetensis TaxID=512763 RepID=UPI0012F75999|nr:hypothetical protein [Rufibacter tibetensis]
MVEREVREVLESNLQLKYRKDLDILYLRWFRVPDSEQLRQGYLLAFELAKEVKSAYWLFDLRSRGQLSPEDEAWMLQTFFPKVEEELGHKNYFSNLVTPSHYSYIKECIGIDYLQNFSEQSKLGVFVSEQDAVAWLLKSRADR